MSNELRHGPVTMHRAIERKIMQEVNARPPDAPRQRAAAAEGDDPSATAERGAPGAAGMREPPREPPRNTRAERPRRSGAAAGGGRDRRTT
jgi:hypothetical protein